MAPRVRVDEKETGNFTKVPNAIAEADWMTGSLLYVYYAIAKHLNYADPSKPAFPGFKTISKITKLSRSQVKRLVKELEQRGVFERELGIGGLSTRYRQAHGGVTHDPGGGVTHDPTVGSPMTPEVEQGTRTKKREKTSKGGDTKRGCSHPDNQVCSRCMVASLKLDPSPALEASDEDF